jgi:pimeloyl-ACP methyl ester carboxylesterase
VPYPFGWRHHVDEMAALIDQLEMGPVHVAGHSRGGAVAFQMALRHPRLVRTLTLADPGGALDTGEAARAPLPVSVNALRARAASLIAEGEREAGLELFVDSVSRPGAWQKSPLAFRTMAEQNAHTLALQFADPLPDYSADTARGIRCPVLLIDGEKSPRMFRQNVEMLERWIDGAQRITIAGASHGMNLAHPAAFNRGIRQFVERSASG